MTSNFRLRAPLTAAIVLLMLIWTVHFIRNSGTQTGATFYDTQVEEAKLVIDGVEKSEEAAIAPVVPVHKAEAIPAPDVAAPIAHSATKASQALAAEPDPMEDDFDSDPLEDIELGTLDASHADIPKSAYKSSPSAALPRATTTPKNVTPAKAPSPLAVGKTQPSDPKIDASTIKQTDRPLVTYVYSQTPSAEANLRFFISHALNSAADFIFIINGEPAQALEIIPQKPNIKVVERENDCYDLGSHAEILTTKVNPNGVALKSGDKGGVERWKMYKKFILLNASIRGPFMPNWANGCWMDAYLSKVAEEVKLVGMTANCWPQFHVQSMIWATDSTGLELLLYPPQPNEIPEGLPEDWKEVGINGCFHTWDEAVHAEVFSTQIIRNAGHKIAVMMSAFYSDEDYIDHCDSGGNGDVLWNGRYFGTNVHPYETIFMKTNRDIDPVLIDKLTSWKKGEGYSSYDHC